MIYQHICMIYLVVLKKKQKKGLAFGLAIITTFSLLTFHLSICVFDMRRLCSQFQVAASGKAAMTGQILTVLLGTWDI